MHLFASFVLLLAVTIAPSDKHAEKQAAYQGALTSIAKHLEDRLAIDFGGSIPGVVFFSPDENTGQSSLGYRAEYDRLSQTITLNTPFVSCDLSGLSGFRYPFRRRRIGDRKPCDPEEIVTVLAHELGHHYVLLTLLRSYHAGWLSKMPRGGHLVDLREWYARRLIDEGVGLYFEYTLRSMPPAPVSDSRFREPVTPSDIETYYFRKRYFYEGGYALVKPVLDQGIERGILCFADIPHALLITSGQWDFSRVPFYRKRVIECASSTR
jgi:hypothetical protein